MEFKCLRFFVRTVSVTGVSLFLLFWIKEYKAGTQYPHVTWAHEILPVKLGYLTLNSGADSRFCQPYLHHVIWRGALVGSRASMPLKFLLSHTFPETWRACRVLFNIVTSCFQKWRNAYWKSAPKDLFIWHQVTRLEISIWERKHGKK
jgi:hypothetical protein